MLVFGLTINDFVDTHLDIVISASIKYSKSVSFTLSFWLKSNDILLITYLSWSFMTIPPNFGTS